MTRFYLTWHDELELVIKIGISSHMWLIWLLFTTEAQKVKNLVI